MSLFDPKQIAGGQSKANCRRSIQSKLPAVNPKQIAGGQSGFFLSACVHKFAFGAICKNGICINRLRAKWKYAGNTYRQKIFEDAAAAGIMVVIFSDSHYEIAAAKMKIYYEDAFEQNEDWDLEIYFGFGFGKSKMKIKIMTKRPGSWWIFFDQDDEDDEDEI